MPLLKRIFKDTQILCYEDAHPHHLIKVTKKWSPRSLFHCLRKGRGGHWSNSDDCGMDPYAQPAFDPIERQKSADIYRTSVSSLKSNDHCDGQWCCDYFDLEDWAKEYGIEPPKWAQRKNGKKPKRIQPLPSDVDEVRPIIDKIIKLARDAELEAREKLEEHLEEQLSQSSSQDSPSDSPTEPWGGFSLLDVMKDPMGDYWPDGTYPWPGEGEDGWDWTGKLCVHFSSKEDFSFSSFGSLERGMRDSGCSMGSESHH